jgi:hypothetical protein
MTMLKNDKVRVIDPYNLHFGQEYYVFQSFFQVTNIYSVIKKLGDIVCIGYFTESQLEKILSSHAEQS